MKCHRFNITVCAIFILVLVFSGCGKKAEEKPQDTINMEEVKKMEQDFKDFAKPIEEQVVKVYTGAATAYWTASLTGKEEDFDKSSDLEIEMNKIFSNKDTFAKIKKFRDSGLILDVILKRDLELMYLAYLSKQLDTAKLTAMTKLQTEITKKFQTYRAKVDGKELTDNDVEDILKTSKDSKKLEMTWKGHKDIGPVVAGDIIKLVKLRNAAAKELGFNNFHEMSLKLNEEDPAEIEKLFDELDNLTRDSFKEVKDEIDAVLVKNLKINKNELMPWHYQNRYFQEAPQIYDLDLDKYYKGKDVVKLTEEYYASLEMPIEKMVQKSDLYEKKGKLQHAFCTDIDRDIHDIRVLCNVKDNNSWMNTMLHEFGHAVYFYYHDTNLPWFIKTPAQIFTTEAIAMMFGRFSSNAQYMQDMLKISEEEKNKIAGTSYKILRLEQLVFSRWAQVMYRFEKGMYANPDQDLNKLWWDIVEKYQMIKKPVGRNSPDWATKVHIATSPCYYHNYLMGELLASQLYHHISTKVLNLPEGQETSFYNKPEAGKFLINNIFAPGAKYYWNEMIEKATGEKLTPKYYAMQFVKN